MTMVLFGGTIKSLSFRKVCLRVGLTDDNQHFLAYTI